MPTGDFFLEVIKKNFKIAIGINFTLIVILFSICIYFFSVIGNLEKKYSKLDKQGDKSKQIIKDEIPEIKKANEKTIEKIEFVRERFDAFKDDMNGRMKTIELDFQTVRLNEIKKEVEELKLNLAFIEKNAKEFTDKNIPANIKKIQKTIKQHDEDIKKQMAEIENLKNRSEVASNIKEKLKLIDQLSDKQTALEKKMNEYENVQVKLQISLGDAMVQQSKSKNDDKVRKDDLVKAICYFKRAIKIDGSSSNPAYAKIENIKLNKKFKISDLDCDSKNCKEKFGIEI